MTVSTRWISPIPSFRRPLGVWCGLHLNSSSVFCEAKYRGGGVAGGVVVHSSQQREERTKKRRRCYRACSLGRCCRRRGLRNSLRSDSPRPSSSADRRPPGPIKAVFPAGHVCYFFNPSPRCLPYMADATQRRSVNVSPLANCRKHRVTEGFPADRKNLLILCYFYLALHWSEEEKQ